MKTTPPRYSGHVALGIPYTAPNGAVYTPIAFRLTGILAEGPNGSVIIPRRTWASFTKTEPTEA